MTDLFKKLNLLLRASLPDLPLSDGDQLTAPLRLGKDVDREIVMLHDRVRDAYAYEAQLKDRIGQLQGEIFALDEAADAAVADGREEQARYHIERMKRAQARLEMAEADLREHQHMTAEFVQRVSQLEEAVARARQAQASHEPGGELSAADVLHDARGEAASAAVETSLPANHPPPSRSVRGGNDDLDQRIERLSK